MRIGKVLKSVYRYKIIALKKETLIRLLTNIPLRTILETENKNYAISISR